MSAQRPINISACCILLAISASARAIPIATGGFNEDEIFDIASGAISRTVDLYTDSGFGWAEQDFTTRRGDEVTRGLPKDRKIHNDFGDSFVLQAYNRRNALRLGDGNDNSGTLSVEQGRYQSLSFLATSGNATLEAVGDVILNFTRGDPTEFGNALIAPDWCNRGNALAAVERGRQRVSKDGNRVDDVCEPNGFAMFNSTVFLSPADQQRTLVSVTFVRHPRVAEVTSIYAVDGCLVGRISCVPEPSTFLLLLIGALGGFVGSRSNRAV